MIPARLLFILAVFWAVLALISVLTGLPALLTQLWLLSGLLLVVLSLLDIWLGLRQPMPNIRRILPSAFALHRPGLVTLVADNRHLPERFELADHHPGDDPDTGMPVHVSRQPGDSTQLNYRYQPSRRGEARFGPIDLWRHTPFGLWLQRQRIGAETVVPVYPDFSALPQPTLSGRRQMMPQGRHARPRPGDGQEFHQLREYRPGDTLRQIDWNATARRRTLISREYREENSQPLILLLDSSARMAMPADDLTAFDHALNACLQLADSALVSGDQPGLLAFSGEDSVWLPPFRNRSGMNRMLAALYPLHTSDGAADFNAVTSTLLRHQRRRATLVLISQLQPDDEDDLLAAARMLGSRHRLLVGDILMPILHQLRQQQANNFDDALRIATEARYQRERRALHARLRHAGVSVTEALPQNIGARLEQLYLTLKRANRL